MANHSEDPHLHANNVGNYFAAKYYGVLTESPENLHGFYHETSLLSRPAEPDNHANEMMYVTPVQADINSMILSFQKYTVQNLNVVSQPSINGAVFVLVTGSLIGIKENTVQRKFTQSFFLAPQDNNGYFVSNDIFQYVDSEAYNVVDEGTPAEVPVVTEPSFVVADLPQTTSVEVTNENGKEVNNINGKEDNNIVVADNLAPQVTTDPAPTSNTQKDDAPKKSYASVVYALKENEAPFAERPRAPITPAALPPKNNSAVEKNNMPAAAKAHAVYVAGLPMNAIVKELEKIFKQFGTIKRNGVQVRSNMETGNCFAFVEFESANSMQNALKASVHYGDLPLRLEERRGSGGGCRNYNYNSRNVNYVRENYGRGGNYGGGRGYGSENSEFPGQTKRNAGRNGEARQNQKSYQHGVLKVAPQPAKVVA